MQARAAAPAFLLALAALAGAANALEDPRPVPVAGADGIESCVGGEPLRFAPGDRRALLDAFDAAAVSAALMRRYPVVERDGLAPQRLVLWNKPAAGWLYVAVIENPTRAREVCYTATFVAARLDVTGPLLVKYFGTGVARE